MGDISAWLTERGLAKYAEAFRDNDIYFDVLRSLSDGELKERKRGLNTLLTRSAPQTSTTGRSSANPTRQVVPSPGSMVAVRWLTRTMVPTTV
jgi:hypothetical protein